MNLVPGPGITNRRTLKAQRLAQQRNKLLRARAALVQKIKRLMQDASEDVPEYSVHPADLAPIVLTATSISVWQWL